MPQSINHHKVIGVRYLGNQYVPGAGGMPLDAYPEDDIYAVYQVTFDK
jgi:hypothetical protein